MGTSLFLLCVCQVFVVDLEDPSFRNKTTTPVSVSYQKSKKKTKVIRNHKQTITSVYVGFDFGGLHSGVIVVPFGFVLLSTVFAHRCSLQAWRRHGESLLTIWCSCLKWWIEPNYKCDETWALKFSKGVQIWLPELWVSEFEIVLTEATYLLCAVC